MSGQTLAQAQKAYRIGDPDGEYAIFDPTGSRLFPGRWNTPASPMIYASADYSTSMLEKLVHGSGRLPPNQHYVEILLSAGLSYEVLSQPAVPGWDHPDCNASRTFGETWHRSRRSLLLFVPSVVARVSTNILINPDHPDFGRITVGLHQPCWWDNRLFERPGNPASAPTASSRPVQSAGPHDALSAIGEFGDGPNLDP